VTKVKATKAKVKDTRMAQGDYIIERVAADSPDRCQCIIRSKGQCLNKVVEGSQYCAVHGGNKAAEAQAKARISNYKLVKWQEKLKRHASSDNIKCLRDEIGILRMTLEERLELCHDSHDLMLQSHVISDLVIKIEKLVKTCHSLEGSMGQLLDKQALLQFAGKVIEIIGNSIEDEAILTTVADQILQAVGVKEEE